MEIKNLKERLEKFLDKVTKFDDECSKFDTALINKFRWKNSNMIRVVNKLLKDME